LKNKKEIITDYKDQLFKGAEKGYCRICGEYGLLTVDHIPPKSCGNNSPVELSVNNGRYITSQNGLKTRSICADCNNKKLGLDFDIELAKLCEEINCLRNKRITIPFLCQKMKIDSEKVIKSILGHILAITFPANISFSDYLSKPLINEGVLDDYRNYVMGKSNLFERYRVYYWYFPFNIIKMIPYFSHIPNFIKFPSSPVSGTLIKFNPLAIFIVDKQYSQVEFDLDFLDFNVKEFRKKIFMKILAKTWPELPDKNGIVMCNGKGMINAKKKVDKYKK